MNSLPSAVFLDRDGTIIEDAHYLSKPEQVRLLPGAARAIARINAVLVPAIVITNQSGIGRGIFSDEDFERITDRLADVLAENGAHLDATYHCPHRPDEVCECRKPGTLLFRNAARDHGIDLSRALYIGDRYRDIEPGITFGGNCVLIPSDETPPADTLAAEERARVAPSLSVALDWFLCSN
ncbi:MAG: HAD family hydrolase [Gemmatimonadales bacterium]